jgi:hypothetical protein
MAYLANRAKSATLVTPTGVETMVEPTQAFIGRKLQDIQTEQRFQRDEMRIITGRIDLLTNRLDLMNDQLNEIRNEMRDGFSRLEALINEKLGR